MNPRQLQQHKAIVYTYIFQAFLPLVLATPYYIASKFCSILKILFIQIVSFVGNLIITVLSISLKELLVA